MNILVMLLQFFLRLLSYALLVLFLIYILAFARPYLGHLESYPYLVKTLNVEKTITDSARTQIRKVAPTTIAGYDFTRFLIIILIIIALNQVNGLRTKLHLRSAYEKCEEEFEKIIKTTHLDEHTKEISELKHDLDELQHAKGRRRKELILHFMEVKGKLEDYEHVLAFLSIDVVGSTAMKKTENPMVISADFYRYNEMADKILKENNVVKAAKTPDGIMAAFSSTDQAVSAAQQLISELDHFNKFVKKMQTDFQVRCGINSGMIYFDPDEPLEHISDRVIDIAGHMQKEAEPNTINIAKSAIAPLEKTGGFTSSEKVIDEQVVYTWKPK